MRAQKMQIIYIKLIVYIAHKNKKFSRDLEHVKDTNHKESD